MFIYSSSMYIHEAKPAARTRWHDICFITTTNQCLVFFLKGILKDAIDKEKEKMGWLQIQ